MTTDKGVLGMPTNPTLRLMLWLVMACFAVEAICNVAYGWQSAGGWDGFPVSGASATAYFAVAALGALFAHIAADVWRRGGLGVAVALVLGLLSLSAFSFSQAAAWRVLGLSLADGAVHRDRAVGVGELAKEELARKRAERAAIGTPRTIGAIEADLALELRKTSKQFPSGDGPAATKLRGELATAQRARALEDEIARAGARVRDAPRVAAAATDTEVIGRLTGASAEQIKVFLPVWLALTIGLFGHFGWALVTLIEGLIDPRGPGAARAGSEGEGAPRGGRDELLQEFVRGLPGVSAALTAPEPGMVQGPKFAQPTEKVMEMRRAADAARAAASRVDLAALPADAPPIDRSGVPGDLAPEERPVADVMLAFRAACVVDAPGGLVSGANLYRRYQAWAGERAVDETAFAALFRRVTGVRLEELSGQLHARDVALRVPSVRQVA